MGQQKPSNFSLDLCIWCWDLLLKLTSQTITESEHLYKLIIKSLEDVHIQGLDLDAWEPTYPPSKLLENR